MSGVDGRSDFEALPRRNLLHRTRMIHEAAAKVPAVLSAFWRSHFSSINGTVRTCSASHSGSPQRRRQRPRTRRWLDRRGSVRPLLPSQPQGARSTDAPPQNGSTKSGSRNPFRRSACAKNLARLDLLPGYQKCNTFVAGAERHFWRLILSYRGCGKGLPRLRQALDFW